MSRKTMTIFFFFCHYSLSPNIDTIAMLFFRFTGGTGAEEYREENQSSLPNCISAALPRLLAGFSGTRCAHGPAGQASAVPLAARGM